MNQRPTHGYMHVALMGGMRGALIAAEMHGRLLESGLYDAFDKITVVVAGDKDQAQEVTHHLFSLCPKYVVKSVGCSLHAWEWSTLCYMYYDSQAVDADFWYVHTKGASDLPQYRHRIVQKNMRSWRGTMSHFVIGQHELCKSLLESYDAVGPYFTTYTGRPHFAGNFWWATSRHIRTLPFNTGLTRERHEAEFWIGKNPSAKLYSLQKPPSDGLYDNHNGIGTYFGETGPFYGIKGGL